LAEHIDFYKRINVYVPNYGEFILSFQFLQIALDWSSPLPTPPTTNFLASGSQGWLECIRKQHPGIRRGLIEQCFHEQGVLHCFILVSYVTLSYTILKELPFRVSLLQCKWGIVKTPSTSGRGWLTINPRLLCPSLTIYKE
jgi:hypothetical protein